MVHAQKPLDAEEAEEVQHVLAEKVVLEGKGVLAAVAVAVMLAVVPKDDANIAAPEATWTETVRTDGLGQCRRDTTTHATSAPSSFARWTARIQSGGSVSTNRQTKHRTAPPANKKGIQRRTAQTSHRTATRATRRGIQSGTARQFLRAACASNVCQQSTLHMLHVPTV